MGRLWCGCCCVGSGGGGCDIVAAGVLWAGSCVMLSSLRSTCSALWRLQFALPRYLSCAEFRASCIGGFPVVPSILSGSFCREENVAGRPDLAAALVPQMRFRTPQSSRDHTPTAQVPSQPLCVLNDPCAEKGEGACEERQAPQAGVQGAPTKAEQVL